MPPDTKQSEKTYLARSGSALWETVKPFSPPGLDTLPESAAMLHEFATAMLALQPTPDDRILDLGAGGGWCSGLLAQLNRQSVAVDISHDMLRVARTRPGVTRASVGDMEALPFRSGTFQKALCFSALHHVPRMTMAVREIARVLDDTGVAFFSEPGKGHAEAACSTTAMRDYGVLEQDVVIEQLMADCHAAGFVEVHVKPLANAIPRFGLSRDEWMAWSRMAGSSRPRRGLTKIMLGIAEILGLGKRGALFEDTFGIRLVRTIQPVAAQHPIVVASKQPMAEHTNQPRFYAALSFAQPPRWQPDGAVDIVLKADNVGTAIWRPSTTSGIGLVAVGVLVVDREGRVVTRDFHRELLPHPVAPRTSMTLAFRCPPPPDPSLELKIDLVAEGVTWFENAGSTPLPIPRREP